MLAPKSRGLLALLLLALALTHNFLAARGSESDEGSPDRENGDRQDMENLLRNNGTAVPDLRQINLIESFFGQVAKTVVYGGATLVQLNTRVLCPLLSFETNPDDTDHPTLFVFNNPDNKEQAYRIYADDRITEEMIREAQFDPNQMTVILVHGWLGGIKNELWLTEAKNAALRVPNSPGWLRSFNFNFKDGSGGRGPRKLGTTRAGSLPTGEDFRPNVIIVDWSEFADGSLFTATKNSFKVSRRLGRLLQQLVKVGGLRPERMHCLGHSIGTHICGQAARFAFPVNTGPSTGGIRTPAAMLQAAENRFGRITGLDPGGFCYERGIKNESTFLGLRPSDALLVDAYYTNRSPLGNRYQVAHYNVRVNNANFQPACSVWRQSELASEYFRTAIRFLMGDSSHTDVLVCDHYFATRFAEQSLVPSCSYVAYACDSYRNFLRGQCGKCDSPRQCYTMDAEYQLTRPSVAHALEKISNYSSLFDLTSAANNSPGPIGGVPYADRPIYYLRVSDEPPYCSITFRIRVLLDLEQIDPKTFRSSWMKLRLLGHQEEVASVRDASTGKVVDTINLNGPWTGSGGGGGVRAEMDRWHLYGVDNRTLTALIELAPKVTLSQAADGRFLQPPITDIIVIYDSENNRRSTTWNPIESIKLDYLSSPDPKIRSKNSRTFHGPLLQVYARRP